MLSVKRKGFDQPKLMNFDIYIYIYISIFLEKILRTRDTISTIQEIVRLKGDQTRGRNPI
jgi:hypothetical protein